MTGVQTCALPISHAGQSHWVPAFAGMTAPGAVAGTASCVLAGITNSRVPARTAIIRIARPGTTDALVAPPHAERRLRPADRRLHARSARVNLVTAPPAAAVGGAAGRCRATSTHPSVPLAPDVRYAAVVVPPH